MNEHFNYELYSGAGNSFVMINNLYWQYQIPLYEQDEFTKFICKEYFKDVDGVIFADKPVRYGPDIRMNYYNRDGSFGAMCGNGSRCLAMYAYKNNLISGKEIILEAVDDIYKAEIIDDKNVKVTFPEPKEIRFNITVKAELGSGLKELVVNYADVGSDHIVLFLDDETNRAVLGKSAVDELDINLLGVVLRNHYEFHPRGANVNFVQPVSEDEIRIRTYERGVERETLACGTGIVSSGIVSALQGKVKTPVKVMVQSKEILIIDFGFRDGRISDLSLTGSAVKLSEGSI